MKNMRLNLITCLLTVLMLCGCGTLFHVWEPKGPFDKSGPIREITVHPGDPNRIYASSENGGVWVIDDFTDESAQWQPMTDFLENLQTRGFAISAIDSEFMVMGNGLGKIHLSFNAGGNWLKINNQSFDYIRRIIADDLEGNDAYSFYVASSTGLYLVNAAALIADPAANVTITTLRSGDITDLVRESVSTGVMYAAARNEGVYRSTDFGRTWDVILVRNPSQMIKISRPSDDGTIFVKDGGTRLFTGNASTPSLTLVPLNNINCAGGAVGSRFCSGCSDIGYRNPFGGRSGDWCNIVAVDPEDPTVVVVGQTNLFSSNDSGATWINNGQPDHEDYHDVLFVEDGLLVANDGGVFKATISEDGTVTRDRAVKKGLNTYQFFRVGVSGANAVGDADHNGVQFTENLEEESPAWTGAGRSRYGNNSLENDFVYADKKDPNRFFVLYRDQLVLRLNLPYTAANGDLLVFGEPQTRTNPFIRFVEGSRNQQLNNLNYAVGTIAQDPRKLSNTMLMSTFESTDSTINEADNYFISISKDSNLNPTGGPFTGINATCGTTYCYDNPVTNFPTWEVSHDNGNTPLVSIDFSPRKDGSVYALARDGGVIYRKDINDDSVQWFAKIPVPASTGETMRQLVVTRKNTRIDTGNAVTSIRPPPFENIHYFETLLAISHQSIYKSISGRGAWIRLPFQLDADNKINSITQHHKNDDHYFVATDRGVFESRDSGTTWRRFGIGLPNAPVMQIFTESQYLYAVTFGRGLWRVDLETLVSIW